MKEKHKYYLLGYAMADGCLATTTKGYDFIPIATTDKEMAYKISEITGTKASRYKTKWKDRYTISIWNRELVDWMKSNGIIKRKTGKETFPNASEKNIKHFIAGYFDGDGMVTIFKNWLLSGFACANKEFLLNIRRVLSHQAGISKDSGTLVKEKSKCYKLRYSVKDTIKLCRFIYNDSDIFMKRKKDTYLRYIKDFAPQRLDVRSPVYNRRWAKIKSDLYGDIESIPEMEYQYVKHVL